MHSFLRTVGFSNITSRKELDKVLGLVMTHPTLDKHAFSSLGRSQVVIRKYPYLRGWILMLIQVCVMICVLALLSYFTCKTQ